jgi:hypothetical protein
MMRLSDAIRLGAMLAPQGFNGYQDAWGRTCALGAALEAIGRLGASHRAYLSWASLYPWLRGLPWRACPACAGYLSEPGLIELIVHLNDTHRWTREQIADWVATIEPREEPAAPGVGAALSVAVR